MSNIAKNVPNCFKKMVQIGFLLLILVHIVSIRPINLCFNSAGLHFVNC